MSTSDERKCANCACFGYMQPDGVIVNQADGVQTVCRRNPPGARQVTIDVPEMRDGKPVTDRGGRPIVRAAKVFQYGYQPVPPEAVCFDGWRPVGELPGASRSPG